MTLLNGGTRNDDVADDDGADHEVSRLLYGSQDYAGLGFREG
ncbi:MAG TPA: hypothetical protein VLL25_04970 [Acidimicrobiales bacterium]|nr:hypothetical protein [Acidimicrobiales bacterium]